jgi:hypothetical protein
MSNKITEPLRLAVGSHPAGSGRGCAMSVISWESGDTRNTDMPECVDPLLARIVQTVNDTYCKHPGTQFLCPECSVEVLALAHRTVGTGTLPLSDLDRRRVWVHILIALVRDADPTVYGSPMFRSSSALRVIDAMEAWVDDPTPDRAMVAVEYAMRTPDLVQSLAKIASEPRAFDYVMALWGFLKAYFRRTGRILVAHRVIDMFEQWTGTQAVPVPADVTRHAYAQMVEVSQLP